MSEGAASGGSTVSASSVITYFTSRSDIASPVTTLNRSAASPRRNRLKSDSLPRLRSHPIHCRSFAFQRRGRCNRLKGAAGAAACRWLSSAIPRIASATISASPGAVSAGASVKSLRIAKCRFTSRLARNCTSIVSRASWTSSTLPKSVGTTTTVRYSGDTPCSYRSSRGNTRGGSHAVTT